MMLCFIYLFGTIICRGIHWPAYGSKRGRCELCSVRGVKSQPTSICNHCRVFLCCNERKNCFAEYHQVDLDII